MKFALFSTALLASSIASASTAINGWYLNGFGGVSHITSSIHARHLGTFRSDDRYHSGWNAGGRIGYQSNPIRYEFEYTYLYANAEHFRFYEFEQLNVSGHANANVLMANLYYDFPEMLSAISPFLGVGIGYSFIETTLDSSGPVGVTLFKEHEDVFSYQGTVGLTYNFSENYAINASYRYMATTRNGSLNQSFQVQMGNAGVIYRFDGGNYK